MLPMQGEVKVYIANKLIDKVKRCEVRQAVSIANGEAVIELENITEEYNDINVNDTVEIYASDAWATDKLIFKGYVRSIKHIIRNEENIIQIRAVDDTNKLHYRFVNAEEFYVWEIGDLVKEIVKDLGFDTSNVNSSFIATEAGPTASYNSGAATMLNGGVTFTCTWSDLDSYIYVKLRGGSYEFRMGKSGNGAYFEFWKGSTRLSYFTLNDFIFSQDFEVRLVARGSEFRVYVKDAQMQTYTKVLDVVDEEFQNAGYVEIGSDAGNSAFSNIKIIDENNMIEHIQVKGRSLFDVLQELAEAKAIHDEYHDFWVDDGKLYFVRRGWQDTGITLTQTTNINKNTCTILESEFEKSLLEVRNKIIVNGATVERYYPWDGDMFTEKAANLWIGWLTWQKLRNLEGYNLADSNDAMVGLASIYMAASGLSTNYGTAHFWFNLPKTINLNIFKSLKLWKKAVGYGSGNIQYIMLASDYALKKYHGNANATENIVSGRYYAMPFIASSDRITLLAVKVDYSADSITGGNVEFYLYDDNNGIPGNLIASASWSYANIQLGGWWWVEFNVSVVPGQKYWLVFRSTLTFSVLNYYYLYYDSSGNGMLYSDDGTTWNNFTGGTALIEIREPQDYFYKSIGANESWNEKELEIGPLSSWNVVGNPDWNNIKSIGITWTDTGGTSYTDIVYIDGLHFVKPSEKVTVVAEDANSQARYGVRELIINDASIASEQRARDVAKAKLALLRDVKRRGRVICNGNVNLQAGKIVTVNIPLQGINNEKLRILEAVHRFNLETKEYLCELNLDEDYPALDAILKKQKKELDEVRARVAALESLIVKT